MLESVSLPVWKWVSTKSRIYPVGLGWCSAYWALYSWNVIIIDIYVFLCTNVKILSQILVCDSPAYPTYCMQAIWCSLLKSLFHMFYDTKLKWKTTYNLLFLVNCLMIVLPALQKVWVENYTCSNCHRYVVEIYSPTLWECIWTSPCISAATPTWTEFLMSVIVSVMFLTTLYLVCVCSAEGWSSLHHQWCYHRTKLCWSPSSWYLLPSALVMILD